jgi:hypothetical protein
MHIEDFFWNAKTLKIKHPHDRPNFFFAFIRGRIVIYRIIKKFVPRLLMMEWKLDGITN